MQEENLKAESNQDDFNKENEISDEISDNADSKNEDYYKVIEKKSFAEKPWLWRKGQSGNPVGREKGKSMKEWAREMFRKMGDEERQEFLKGMPKEIIWKMAEGMPDTKTDLTSKGEKITIPIYGGLSKPE